MAKQTDKPPANSEVEGQPSEGEHQTCFVIGPIGEDGSEERRRFEALVDHVVTPALKPLGFKVGDPHRDFQATTITTGIISRLLEADLVIADVTGSNANVMYELAVRHAKRKPTIMISELPLILPFDLKDEYTITYRNDIKGGAKLAERLVNLLPDVMEENPVSNPVYRAAEQSLLDERVREEGTELQKEILAVVRALESKTSTLARVKSPDPEVLYLRTQPEMGADVAETVVHGFGVRSATLIAQGSKGDTVRVLLDKKGMDSIQKVRDDLLFVPGVRSVSG